MGASVSRGPLEVWPKSLVNHSLALPRVAGCSGGHTDGQRIASHEQEEREAEFWKQGVDSHPDPSANVLRGLHSPTGLHSTWAQHRLSA